MFCNRCLRAFRPRALRREVRIGGCSIRQGREGLPRRHPRGRRLRSRDRRRRVHGPGRTVRMRKDHRAADGCRAGDDLGGRPADRGARRQPCSRAGPRHRHGLPELRALPTPLRLRQHRLRPPGQEGPEGRDRQARQGRRAHPRPRAVPQTQAEGPVGRPASAGRNGPRDRPAATGVPHGRAAFEPRREAPRSDAGGDRPPPERSRRHDHLRHARPDGGDDDGRPGCGDAQGRAAAGRRTAGALRPAPQPLRRRLHRKSRDEHGRGDRQSRERRLRSQDRRPLHPARRGALGQASGAQGARRAHRDRRNPARASGGCCARPGGSTGTAPPGDGRPARGPRLGGHGPLHGRGETGNDGGGSRACRGHGHSDRPGARRGGSPDHDGRSLRSALAASRR